MNNQHVTKYVSEDGLRTVTVTGNYVSECGRVVSLPTEYVVDVHDCTLEGWGHETHIIDSALDVKQFIEGMIQTK